METRQICAFTGLQIVAVCGLLWFLLTAHAPWDTTRYVGTALVVIGITFIAIARYQLGKSFSIKAEAHAMITTGLYSKIRNPIYVFGTVMLAGMILILQRPALWILLVVVVIGQTIRAHREAQVLEAAFGDAYREYRRKTWF